MRPSQFEEIEHLLRQACDVVRASGIITAEDRKDLSYAIKDLTQAIRDAPRK